MLCGRDHDRFTLLSGGPHFPSWWQGDGRQMGMSFTP